MIMLGFVNHRGRMSAQQAAAAVATCSRHRAGVTRFLLKHGHQLPWLRHQCGKRLLHQSGRRGLFVFIVDTTSVGHS